MNGSPDNSVVDATPHDAIAPLVAINLTSADGKPINAVRLSPRNLCRAFIEPALTWADPDIAADNPETLLPDLPVSPVANAGRASVVAARALANYCMANAPEQWARWADEMSASRTTTQTFSAQVADQIEWPAAVSTDTSVDEQGALAIVASRPGSITLLMSTPAMPDGVVVATLTDSLHAAATASVDAARPSATLLRTPLRTQRGNPWVPRTVTIALIALVLFIRRRMRGRDQPSRLL